MTTSGLVDAAAYYDINRSKVVFSWRLPQGSFDHIHIVPAQMYAGGRQCDFTRAQSWAARDAARGYEQPLPQPPASVMSWEYYVFASDGGIDWNALGTGEPEGWEHFVTRLVVGRANVKYRVAQKRRREGFCSYTLTVHSDTGIQEQILGYSFALDGMTFTLPLSGAVSPGTTTCPPLLLPEGTEVVLKATDPLYQQNVSIIRQSNCLFERMRR